MSNSSVLSAGPQAFGDGSHPTTAGVLAALAAIDPAAFAPRIALDVGAGSGILSLAIARAFGCPVVATDISAQAIETLQENMARAGLDSAAIRPIHADGFRHPDISAHAPYDLIVMNILAAPLVALARDAGAHLTLGGVLILSGLLQWQETTIREAYAALGLELASRLVIGDWVTLCWSKEG